MSLREVSFPIPFARGLDTKTDPKQVQIGKFLELENMVFTNEGLLQKRNGYKALTTLMPANAYLTTLNGNLTAVGETVSAYSAGLNKWITKGTLQPCSLNTLSLIKNNFNQTQSASAIASDGLICITYTEIDGGSNTYKYVIADSITGQNIVEPSIIPALPSGAITGSSRVFIVGPYFVIVSQVLVGGTTFLQYTAIPSMNPVNADNTPNISTPQTLTPEAYVPVSSNPGWDGVAINNTSNHILVVAYNSTTTAQGVHVTAITQQQIALGQSSSLILQFNNAAYIGAIVSICVDLTVSPNIFYISFWNNATMNGYTFAVFLGFNSMTQQFPPQQIITASPVDNLASAAQNDLCTVFSEVDNVYGYDGSINTNFINSVSITSLGVVGVPFVSLRSVGLASKAFIVNGTVYYLSAQDSIFQDTYFLINGSLSRAEAPIIVSKLAYENGGGYVTLGLPNVDLNANVARITYLFKDLIEPLNTLNNTQQTTTGGVYSQTGINLVSFNIGTTNIDTSEIANTLHLSGGFLGMYDGYLPVEQNFFIWPENVEVTTSGSGGSITAQEYFYQAIYEWTDNQGNIHRSAPSIPVSITTTGSTSSNTINIPTLRLTMKTANPVKIIIYRWSTAQQIYYQITSVTTPLLNDTTIDSVSFVDTQADSAILGNSIIYTTGGVVENINAPSTDIMTIFDTRFWEVDAEDPNLLWYSKQIIEAVPVEMSDLFTLFIAPNTGTTGSTGPITALAPMDDKLIIFKKDAIYYINGIGPDNTGSNSGYSQPIFITSTVGCDNQHSVVLVDAVPGRTDGGLMFQSDKGIWLLDRGLQTTYVGADVEKFNSSTVNSANAIPETNQVRFTLDTGETLLYDYFYGQWGTFIGASAISSCIYQDLHTFINRFGTIFQETPGLYLDGANPVLMSFVTSNIQLQGISGYQRLYEFQLLGSYITPHLLNVKLDYNFGALSEQALIQPTNATGVFGSDALFGQTSPYGGPGDLEQWRVQPSVQLCQSFQISLQEVYDASFGIPAGAGFTLSAITCTLGLLRSYRPVKGDNTTGTN